MTEVKFQVQYTNETEQVSENSPENTEILEWSI